MAAKKKKRAKKVLNKNGKLQTQKQIDNPGWSDTKMTKATLQLLKEWFLMWLTDREACLFADICKSTLYNYQDKNPDYVDQKELWKDQQRVHAKMTIAAKLKPTTKAQRKLDKDDPKKLIYWGVWLAMWYLSNKSSDEFSPRQIVDQKWNMQYEMTKKVELTDKANKTLEALLKKSKSWRSSKKPLTKTGKKSKKS